MANSSSKRVTSEKSEQNRRRLIAALLSVMQAGVLKSEQRMCEKILELILLTVEPRVERRNQVFVSLKKDRLQEDFIQGTMGRHPYSLSEIGSTAGIGITEETAVQMKHLLEKVIIDCQLAISADMLECLVNNTIVNSELSVAQVYDLWFVPLILKKRQQQLALTSSSSDMIDDKSDSTDNSDEDDDDGGNNVNDNNDDGESDSLDSDMAEELAAVENTAAVARGAVVFEDSPMPVSMKEKTSVIVGGISSSSGGGGASSSSSAVLAQFHALNAVDEYDNNDDENDDDDNDENVLKNDLNDEETAANRICCNIIHD